MSNPSSKTEPQVQDEFTRDLYPNQEAGQNDGLDAGTETEKDATNAYDMKDMHREFSGFTDDELKQVPVLAAGTRLKQGAVYVDLNDPQLQEVTARGDMEAGANNRYVPKSEVDYELWNRLIGIDNAERTGE